MDALALDQRHAIGANYPPEPDPFDAIKCHVEDLAETARGFLDGSGVTTQAEADAVSKLMDEGRKASKAADGARADEKRPHDEAGKAVQAKFKPLIESADRVVTICKQALAPFLMAQEAEKRRIAEEARAVLFALLGRHADLRPEALDIARALLTAVDVEDVAIGQDDGDSMSVVIIGRDDYEEHMAQLSVVSQAGYRMSDAGGNGEQNYGRGSKGDGGGGGGAAPNATVNTVVADTAGTPSKPDTTVVAAAEPVKQPEGPPVPPEPAKPVEPAPTPTILTPAVPKDATPAPPSDATVPPPPTPPLTAWRCRRPLWRVESTTIPASTRWPG
jgi:hypothetical protein